MEKLAARAVLAISHAGRLHQVSGPIREQKLRAGEQAMPGWETSMSRWRGFSAHCGRQYVNHTMQRALCRDLYRDGQGCVELSTFSWGQAVRSEWPTPSCQCGSPQPKARQPHPRHPGKTLKAHHINPARRHSFMHATLQVVRLQHRPFELVAATYVWLTIV